MKATEKLLRAVEAEFGQCPTWIPLIEEASKEVAQGKRPLLNPEPAQQSLRRHDGAFWKAVTDEGQA